MKRPLPPLIFSPRRRAAAQSRAQVRQTAADSAARFLPAEAAEDVIERLAFLRHQPRRALVLGDWSGLLVRGLADQGTAVETQPIPSFSLEHPWPGKGYDFIAALFVLDHANDLPGALIHLRQALAQGGLALTVLVGAGSLPALRAALLAADAERPAARLHPQVDVRAGAQLLQRAGFADPVADSHPLTARYSSLMTEVADLRDHGLTGVLADSPPPLGKSALARAMAAYLGLADGEGRVSETFELLTLSGWRR